MSGRYSPRQAKGPSPEVNTRIIRAIAKYRHDPLGFVNFAFPWGEKGTVLENWGGPQLWQANVLARIGAVMQNPDRGKRKVRIAVASGKGIGKSALIAQVFWWGISSAPYTKARITAGTDSQLRTTTWPEVQKWHSLLLCRHWFHLTATMATARSDADNDTWRADALPWNESNPEAFAGVHNLGRRIVFIMDEASQIATPIWDTTDGILTDKDTEIIWLAFGNPTRGEGRFYDIFESSKGSGWTTINIDSRDVAITDKAILNGWVDEYGEDHDYVRAFVRGVFPRMSDMQFIGPDMVRDAMARQVEAGMGQPLVMGLDIARSLAGDETVISFRKGRDARSIPWVRMRTTDTMEIAAKAADLFTRYRAQNLFVDSGGVGGGVYDRLRQMGIPAIGVDFGKPDDRASAGADPARYANKRAAMWGALKAWLPGGGLPNERGLVEQLSGPMYGFSTRKGVEGILLESKEDMKKRGLGSPDMGDSLALTFAYETAPPPRAEMAGGPQHASRRGQTAQAATEYDHLAG